MSTAIFICPKDIGHTAMVRNGINKWHKCGAFPYQTLYAFLLCKKKFAFPRLRLFFRLFRYFSCEGHLPRLDLAVPNAKVPFCLRSAKSATEEKKLAV